MKITDFVLTPEGSEYRTQLIDKLYEEDPTGSINSGPTWEQLQTLNAVEGWFYREDYSMYLKMLPNLERRGFVEKVTDVSAKGFLDHIRNPIIKQDLEIYHRMAMGEEVSRDEVDYLFNKCKGELGASVENRPFGGAYGDALSILSQLRNAKTRSEKILAVDRTMSLMHDQGGVASFGFWGIDWEVDPDAEISTKFLTRLFEGD